MLIFLISFSFFIKYEIAKIKIIKPKSIIKAVLFAPKAMAIANEEKYRLFLSFFK